MGFFPVFVISYVSVVSRVLELCVSWVGDATDFTLILCFLHI